MNTSVWLASNIKFIYIFRSFNITFNTNKMSKSKLEYIWLDGYKPTPAAEGVFAAASMGTKPYPMRPFQSLLHTALGAELPDYMQGKETAEEALADVEAAYTAAAKEQGFLK